MTRSFKNILVLLILFSVNAMAQTELNDTTKMVDGMKIYIPGEGRVTVNYGKKIGDDPLFQDSSKITTDVKYFFLDKKRIPEFKVKKIKAPKIRMVEPLEKIRKRFVAFGINDFKTTPMAELRYSTLRNRKYNLGFDMRHFSQKQNVGSPIDAIYGNSTVSIYGKRFLKGNTFYGSADYDNNVFNFHGFDKDQFISYNPKDLKRNVGRFKLKTGVKSISKDPLLWGYNVGVNYNQLSLDEMSSVEHRVNFDANLNKYLDWSKYEWFKGFMKLDYTASYLNSGRPTKEHESFYFKVFPSFELQFKEIDFTFGAKAFYQSDIKKLNAMPYLEGDWSFVKDVLHIFGRFQNSYKRLSYLDYIYENPFVFEDQDILNVNIPVDFMGGIKGGFSAKSSFSLGFRYRNFKSMPIYSNLSSNPTLAFNVETDKVVNRQGFLEFLHESKKLNVLTKLEYNLYDVFELDAYNLPAFYGETRLGYKLQDKFVLGTDLFFYGEQLGRVESSDENNRQNSIVIDPIFDFNIDFRYNYSQKLGAFIKTNNILNTKHQRWDQYANYGFNILIGVDYNF
tara:strand:- start:586 stop:2277 length:1692 start_codon:yes stop_codon:yes gene_type:complete